MSDAIRFIFELSSVRMNLLIALLFFFETEMLRIFLKIGFGDTDEDRPP
jgi:hypothetical protein